jgi:hypothetical protein
MEWKLHDEASIDIAVLSLTPQAEAPNIAIPVMSVPDRETQGDHTQSLVDSQGPPLRPHLLHP